MGESSFNLNDPEKVDNATVSKAKYFDEMCSQIKDKIRTSDKWTITQLVTLAPKSMPVKRVMKTFNVTKYQAMKGKELYREKGILALPPVLKGPKTLQENTIKSIISFYENDEFFRIMPWKKRLC